MLSLPPALLVTLFIVTIQAAITTISPSSRIKSTDNVHAGGIRFPNPSSSSLGFLGVNCYYLVPDKDTVTIQACQPLFAALVRHGHIYKQKPYYNNFIFQYAQEPCVLKIFSPANEDRLAKANLSVSQIISYTTEILETCQHTGTGGANVFEGQWRISVSRNMIKTEWNDFAAPTSNYTSIANSSIIPLFSTSTTSTITNSSAPLSLPNFLGVQCYHLHRETDAVTILTCQPLFAQIFSKGNVYDPKKFRNGFTFRARNEPCVIRISSPDPQYRFARVMASLADVVRYATEVLRMCGGERGGRTGGYNVFEGEWRVEVARSTPKVEKRRE